MSSTASEPSGATRTPAYAWYVLALLSVVYLFNFLDRQILSILAQAIKADLGVTDARLGFLYGTAFAIFYAVFGIPLARLADVWVRKNVIALGLACWSLMTALSGTASGFGLLAVYRIGVGVGESSASPAAYSMLSDSFPAERRATAFALYAAGLYVGQGIGYYLGGWIVDAWAAHYPSGDGILGLRGWQAAFLAVGMPGLLLAAAVAGLREPARERVDREATSAPGRVLLTEIAAVIPPLTLWSLSRAGASRAGIALNIGVGIGIASLSAALVSALGPPEQWIALGIGVYAAFSWVQGLALRDRPAFQLLFRGRASVALLAGSGVMTLITYAFMFWSAPFLQRVHGVSPRDAGFYLMIASVFGGGAGVTLGGWLSDAFKRRAPAGRVYVMLIGLLIEIPAGLSFLFAPDVDLAFAMAIAFNVASTLWVGSTNAVITELVIPRMRAISTAAMLTGYTFIGLALGPYAVGRVSDALIAGGTTPADALRWALASAMLVSLPSLLLLWRGARTIEADEASVFERARQAGEPV